MTTPPILTTDRLVLRGYRDDEFDLFAALLADPIVIHHIGGKPLAREDSWSRFLRAFGMWERMGFGFFLVEDRASGAYLGEVGFQERRRDITPSIEGTIEAGWALVPSAHGKGYATEAIRAALAWSDDAHRGARYTALIAPENAASQNVAAKVGFRVFEETMYHDTPVLLLER